MDSTSASTGLHHSLYSGHLLQGSLNVISELRISNFRSLGPDTRLGFGAMTALVGPNGAGKSNALDALSFVRDAITLGLPAAVTHRGGIEVVRRRSHGHPFNVSIELDLSLPSGPA